MYTVTFYSYKGGVGRSMALANVAFLLAKAGKKVLVVDFDLEAPGISKYQGLGCASGQKGIVEYIHEYVATKTAPDVSSFITPCSVAGRTIWIMPAGEYDTPHYGRHLNEIDWNQLYEEYEGFLFFEDLKQQWAQFGGSGFDYVLVDSRTGHTDVGGICTRQLPDAVAVLFVPTTQNVDGLMPIVKAIRAVRSPVKDNHISLHFCPSNVPDLDDQESILVRLLDEAKEKLDYNENASVIQHYSSLDLLELPIYAATSPKTKLVKQYTELYTSIIAENLADSEGAAIAIHKLSEKYNSARESDDRAELTAIGKAVSKIRALHGKDASVAWSLAALANEMNEIEEEEAALSTLVEQGIHTPRVLLHRAFALSGMGKEQAAIADLERIFSSDNLSLFDVAPASNLLRRLSPTTWRQTFREALVRGEIDPAAKGFLAHFMLFSREGCAFAAAVTSEVSRRAEGEAEVPMLIEHVLGLIGSRQFREAKEFLFDNAFDAVASESIYDVFNYAVADWAVSGTCNVAIFQRVIELRPTLKTIEEPNLHQCIALAHMVCADWEEAGSLLKSALKMNKSMLTFSCWSYLQLEVEEFNADVKNMLICVNQKRLSAPPFFFEE